MSVGWNIQGRLELVPYSMKYLLTSHLMLDTLFLLMQRESELVLEEMGPPESSRWTFGASLIRRDPVDIICFE